MKKNLFGANCLVKNNLKRIASIDIGTNSIHLVAAEINDDKTFSIIHKERDIIRLGEGIGESSKYNLKEDAIDRALQKIADFKSRSDSLGVTEILAGTTSAVRSAGNGQTFLNSIKNLGIDIQLISGEEECLLIYYGVKSDPFFSDQSVFIIDMGGGSCEFIAEKDSRPDFITSLELGALRMKSMFFTTDPPNADDINKLEEHVKKLIDPIVINCRGLKFGTAAGTSGAVFSLVDIIKWRQGVMETKNLNHEVFTLDELKDAAEYLCSISLEERLKIPRLHPLRADIIHAGAVVLATVMETLGINTLTACDRALREGLIYRFIHAVQPEH